MKLIPPNLPIGQGFGDNADGAYAADGLLGHPGIDFGSNANYGQPIACAIEGAIVSALLSENNPNLAAFRAVNTIFEDSTGCYEIQYGHDMQEVVSVGDVLHLGQEVATIGNTGEVFIGNPAIEVTEAQKEVGSHAGAHIHFQVRVITKESASTPLDSKKHYLNDGTGLLTLNGFHYYVPSWNNGYDGCVDPTQFFGLPTEESPADKLTDIANSMMATNLVQAKIILAVAAVVRAFT